MRVGIFAGACKPCHRGHWALIKRASQENDRVELFISTADRGGGDVTITGNAMREVWERFLEPHLPANVKLSFCHVPIRRIYEFLGDANLNGSIDEFRVYSDPVDIEKRFPQAKRVKYFGDLVKHRQVTFVPVERGGDNDVSSTQLRELLGHGMREEFMSLLPEGVDRLGIWELLVLGSVVRDA